jgi:hypothetical protein
MGSLCRLPERSYGRGDLQRERLLETLAAVSMIHPRTVVSQ